VHSLRLLVRKFWKKTSYSSLIIFLIVAVSAALCVLIFSRTSGGSVSKGGVQNRVVSSPSEQKPGQNYRWQGSPKEPKKIVIASIGVDGFVQKVGVDQNKEVAVPNNIHIGGWFTQSMLPGEKGLSIIDGHVDGKTQDGIFANLVKIKPDAEVSIEFGDSSKKVFRVLAVDEVEEASAASILFSQNPKVANQLNLITCGGDFNEKTRRYEKRVIVSTKLQSPN